MKKIIVGAIIFAVFVSTAFSAYHHEGEMDTDIFLEVYPGKAGTKLDHCASCHSGGEYEKKPGKFVSLGSCQWCHHSYGYDGSGNIADTLNEYGKDYYTNGRDADALKAIESLDSDGDGFTNKAEIEADRFPGNADDDPDKKTAPSRVYTREQLEEMPSHTQFLLMNTSRSGDFYAEYTGVPLEVLLKDSGVLDSATGVTVYAPDGWSQYHPLEYDETPELYHVFGTYPSATYQYDPDAEQWCDYSASSCTGRSHNDPINVTGELKMLLAYEREGVSLDTGILNQDNKLDGEGPYRIVVPQKEPCPPDQSSRADDQNVKWPYVYEWDHNAGSCTRSATIIKVEPLPEGTTDIDLLEAGWSYIDQEKIVIYGAIDNTVRISGNVVSEDGTPLCAMILANGQHMFSCAGGGRYELDVPLNDDGEIVLFSFCDGFAQFKKTMKPDEAADSAIIMSAASPDSSAMTLTKNFSPAVANPGWVEISGTVMSGETPLCAMVLANGQHVFSCNDSGTYKMEVPLNNDGEIDLLSFCDGFMPYSDDNLKPE